MGVAISIGMPVFNGETYVEQAVLSITQQSFGDFELIISDNASTDGTAEICAAWAERDPRVRLLRSSRNEGAAANFNRVLAAAQAPLFKWACADDLCAPELLARCRAALLADPGVVLAFGRTTLIDADGAVLGVQSEGLELSDEEIAIRWLRACVHAGQLNVLQGVTRTAALRSTGGFGNYPGADGVLMAELALRGRFQELDVPLLSRRMHAGAASAGRLVRDRQEHLDPRTTGRLSLWHWRRHYELARAIDRSDLTFAERTRLRGIVCRCAYWRRRELLVECGQVARHLVHRLLHLGRAAA